jgi:acyl dehydratase
MPQFDPGDFQVLYPGVFIDRERELAEKYVADNRALTERGDIDVQALVSGKLPADTPGLVAESLFVAEDMVRYNNHKYDPENPLLRDADYARRAGYKDILAMPCYAHYDDGFMVPYPPGARDTLLVSQLNHNVTSYRPIYPGDTLYMVSRARTVTDLTPTEGSIHRSLALRTEGHVYNQRGEKVTDSISRVVESVALFKNDKRPKEFGFQDVWEAPNWTVRRAHYYTDADWELITGIWAKERRQGAKPLYWEHVKVGDEPAWTADGPIDDPVMPTSPFGMGTGGSRTLKKEIMDPAVRATLIRSEEDGIYRPADRSVYVPPIPEHTGVAEYIPPLESDAGAIDTRDIHRAKGTARSPLMNFYGRDIAMRHINNWMGDKGWLSNIRWGLMPVETMAAYGKSVPMNPDGLRFLEVVPSLEGRAYANAHGLTRDMAIVKSYVYDKYVRDLEFFVDLAWWIESIEGDIWLEGGATVKLPSTRAR